MKVVKPHVQYSNKIGPREWDVSIKEEEDESKVQHLASKGLQVDRSTTNSSK
jgi:hypothetical protein